MDEYYNNKILIFLFSNLNIILKRVRLSIFDLK